jgi:hypothetical protein
VALLDQNNDEILSPVELKAYFSKEQRIAQVKAMNSKMNPKGEWAAFKDDLDEMDSDKSNTLSVAEVVNPRNDLTPGEIEQEKVLFAFADVDGNGELSAQEYLLYVSVYQKSEMDGLQEALEVSVRPLLAQIMKTIDTDKDGLLSLQEIQANSMDLLEPLATGKPREPIQNGRTVVGTEKKVSETK